MGQILSGYSNGQQGTPRYTGPTAGGSITGNRYGYNTPGNSKPGGLITSGPYTGYNNTQGLGANGKNPGTGGRPGAGLDNKIPMRSLFGGG